MVEIDVDTSELEALKEKLLNGMQAGVVAVTEGIEEAAHERASDIAARPIPIGPSGAPLWERTGDLEAGIESSFPSAETGRIEVTGPAEEYSQRRHQLGESDNGFGKGWTPKNPAEGIIRNDPFFKDALADKEPEIAGDFEAAFNAEINS